MALMSEQINSLDDDLPSDDELARRTRILLEAAESISKELAIQTERLAETINVFNRQIVTPLRHLTKDELLEQQRANKEKY